MSLLRSYSFKVTPSLYLRYLSFELLLVYILVSVSTSSFVYAGAPPPPPVLKKAVEAEEVPEKTMEVEKEKSADLSKTAAEEQKIEAEKHADASVKMKVEVSGAESKEIESKKIGESKESSQKIEKAAAQLRRQQARLKEAGRRGGRYKKSSKSKTKFEPKRRSKKRSKRRKSRKKRRERTLESRVDEVDSNATLWILGGASALSVVSTLFGALGVWGIYLATTTFGADAPVAAISMMGVGLIGAMLSGGPLGVLLVDMLAAAQLEGDDFMAKTWDFFSETNVATYLGGLSWCGLPVVGLLALIGMGAFGVVAPQVSMFMGGAACGAASCALIANVATPLLAGVEISSWFDLQTEKNILDRRFLELKKQEDALHSDRNQMLIQKRKDQILNKNKKNEIDAALAPQSSSKMRY